MGEPFLGEIKMVGFNFAPRNWAMCDGAMLPINQNQSLYSLIGTTYGGDGRSNFSLPDLRGRTPVHRGNSYERGDKLGVEAVALSAKQVQGHTHSVNVSSQPPSIKKPSGNALGAGTFYHTPGDLNSMNAKCLEDTGGGEYHNNIQPSLTLNFCIALKGLFPSRN